MISRRHFLQAGTVAVGTGLGVTLPLPALAENCAPLPPSIEALKSMKDQAKPITSDERRERSPSTTSQLVTGQLGPDQ